MYSSSLCQALIVVSFVYFLVCGQTEDSASERRIQDLEDSVSRLLAENAALRLQRKNLTNLLSATLTERARGDFDHAQQHQLWSISLRVIGNLETRLQQCNLETMSLKLRCGSCSPPVPPVSCNCGPLLKQLKARYDLLESNFTQTTQRMRMEMEQIVKERDNLNLETIRLRRDKSTQEKELEEHKNNAKAEMSMAFGNVRDVSRALMEKIESLFPRHIAFQLTCPKQREHLEQIHTNCTSLSREVEDKLQRYLDTVGEQMSSVYFDNNHLKAENWRLNEDYRWCSQNRTAMVAQHRQSMNKLQEKYDKEKEQLLMDKMRLNGDKEVLLKTVKYKSTEVDHLTERVRQLNMSCMLKPGGLGFQPNTNPGWNSLGGGSNSSSSSSNSFGQLGRTGLGLGSSLNNQGSTRTGSSSSSFPSSGSNSGLSNTGSGFNKPGPTRTGSLGSFFPSSGSGSSLSSGGTGSNNWFSSGSSTSIGSSGSTSKSGSTSSGFSWFGTGNSNSGQSKTGSTPRKTSSGTSYGGTGSSFGDGRTSGFEGGPGSISQHLQYLQRLINPRE